MACPMNREKEKQMTSFMEPGMVYLVGFVLSEAGLSILIFVAAFRGI